MSNKNRGNTPPNPNPQQKTAELNLDTAPDFKDLEKAGKRGLLGRFNAKLNDAIQTGRAPETVPNAVAETTRTPAASIDDIAMRRARNVGAQKMVIPEGVIIEGSLTGSSDTEISGRIDGNITVDGALHLGPGALVSGNVRAGTCRIDGLVEGKVECSGDLELGPNGRLNADVFGGHGVRIAGQVYGNISTPGTLTLAANSKVTGDVSVRKLIIEEGATLEGKCTMRAPAPQRSEKTTQ